MRGTQGARPPDPDRGTTAFALIRHKIGDMVVKNRAVRYNFVNN